jgi:hypothetical protein
MTNDNLANTDRTMGKEVILQRLRYPCGTANPLFNSVMPILYVPD